MDSSSPLLTKIKIEEGEYGEGMPEVFTVAIIVAIIVVIIVTITVQFIFRLHPVI